MRRSRIELAKELITTQMNHWFFITIAITALGLFNCNEPYIFLCAGLGILPVYGYFLREKIKVFPLFIILSVVPAGMSVAVPMGDVYVKALMIVFSLFYGIYSIYLRTRADEPWDAPVSPVVSFCVMGGLFILLNSQRDVDWDSYYILAALVYFAFFLIGYFMVHFLTFITVNDSSAANIPEKAIFETGLKQTLMFTGAVIAFLAIVANINWLAAMLAAIKKAIVAFISKYLQFTPEQAEAPEHWMQPLESGGDGFFDQPGEPAFIWVVLQYVAIVVVLLGILIAVCYGLYKGYGALLSGFKRVRKVEEQKLAENDDIHEQVEIVRKERDKSRNIFEAFSVTERIRKTYRKRVEKERYTLVKDGDLRSLSFFTAKECCDQMGTPNLKLAYEKARYSNANCTNEDLKAAKS